ncbi:hypothetical protein COZ82_03140 [Candidatus Kaiserbacteria bacterium CG_4_8_14_3_um_filter_38_9]|uniref:Uncharacterized protein n=1 Tax=Candidatus Kaiserbacteria bacterium CG_4_8_14_3_um_filter_38_9 TaxID=1974599 RepID=A0A2M7INC6_9BACT|nr:MAG: hypothetical protein COZ82_03140 [Candidatus Kaiserbacteria bacterium CG_4_8_14_3_um_filter_38_9]
MKFFIALFASTVATSALADIVTLCPSLEVAETTVNSALAISTNDMTGAEALLVANCPASAEVTTLGVVLSTIYLEGEPIEFRLAADGTSVALVPPSMFGHY